MIQHNQLHFMHAKDSDKEEILALYHSLVGTEYCAWTQEYPGEKEFAYDMGRDALFCLKNDKGEIVGTITIDQVSGSGGTVLLEQRPAAICGIIQTWRTGGLSESGNRQNSSFTWYAGIEKATEKKRAFSCVQN